MVCWNLGFTPETVNLSRDGRLDELEDIKRSDKTWREYDCSHWEDRQKGKDGQAPNEPMSASRNGQFFSGSTNLLLVCIKFLIKYKKYMVQIKMDAQRQDKD
jgi:hypothetical protein